MTPTPQELDKMDMRELNASGGRDAILERIASAKDYDPPTDEDPSTTPDRKPKPKHFKITKAKDLGFNLKGNYLVKGLLDNEENETPSREPTEAETSKAITQKLFNKASLTATSFMELDIPERETLLSPFFKAGDYGLIFAPRGIGKSWLSLMMARAVAEAGMMGSHYQANTARKTLYIDSEMDVADLHYRCRLLNIKSDNFHVMNHEILFKESDDALSLNLTDITQQQAILTQCEEMGIEVLILDNLSTAFRGLKENDADSWELISPWLLDLRRRGIAVVLVAHAGRNGQIRGTSRREDMAHWILSLEEVETIDEGEGIHEFKTRFTKCRNVSQFDTPSLSWKMTTENGKMFVETKTIDLFDMFLELVQGGMSSATDLADELGKGKGTISKWAKRASNDGKIAIKNGRYLPAS